MSCHPECAWVCDDPRANADCSPECDEPQCHIEWRETNPVTSPPPDPLLAPPDGCAIPEFTSSLECPAGQCELNNCPMCSLMVTEITQDCPDYTVEVVCQPTNCQWNCQQPELRTPDCQLQCELPSCASANSFQVIHTNAVPTIVPENVTVLQADEETAPTAELTFTASPAPQGTNGFEVATYVLIGFLTVAIVVAIVFIVLYVQKVDIFA